MLGGSEQACWYPARTRHGLVLCSAKILCVFHTQLAPDVTYCGRSYTFLLFWIDGYEYGNDIWWNRNLTFLQWGRQISHLTLQTVIETSHSMQSMLFLSRVCIIMTVQSLSYGHDMFSRRSDSACDQVYFNMALSYVLLYSSMSCYNVLYVKIYVCNMFSFLSLWLTPILNTKTIYFFTRICFIRRKWYRTTHLTTCSVSVSP